MTYHLLIVDDEPIVRNGLLEFDWEAFGFEAVGACENGREALEWLNRHPVDLVLTDIKMPGIDGVELSRRIRDLYPEMLVVLLTGYNEFAYAQQAIKSGVFDYLLKPAEDSEFETVLKKAARVLKQKAEQKRLLEALLHHRDREAKDWPGLFAVFKRLLRLPHLLVAANPAKLEEELSGILKDIETGALSEDSIQQALTYLIITLEEQFEKLPHFSAAEWSGKKQMYLEAVHSVHRFEKIKRILIDEIVPFLRNIGADHIRLKESAKLDEVLRFIREHYGQVLSLDLMAERAGMHPHTFSKWFKENSGMNFIDYVTRCRIDRAKELLEGTGLKTSQIAEQVGIADARYFGQVFKKLVGLTPSEYRALFS